MTPDYPVSVPDVSRETLRPVPAELVEITEPAETGVVDLASSSPDATPVEAPEMRSGVDVGGVPQEQAAPRSAATKSKTVKPPAGVEPVERPTETRIIVIANQKGGVGKTTTAVNLAAGLAMLEQEVLVLDMDPQGNASTALSLPHEPGVMSVYDVLVNGKSLADAVSPVPDMPHLWAVPATVDLAGAEIELVSQVARENRLRKALQIYIAEHAERHQRRLDYVIIDCPPSLGLLTLNALVAGEELLVPLQTEYYALEGLTHLMGSVALVKEHLNPTLAVSAILLTMYDARTKLAPQVADEVLAHFPGQVLSTRIPRSVRVSEAPSYGLTVLQYDPGSRGAKAYLAAAEELAGFPQAVPRPAEDEEPGNAPELSDSTDLNANNSDISDENAN